jgi:hypothetical protein
VLLQPIAALTNLPVLLAALLSIGLELHGNLSGSVSALHEFVGAQDTWREGFSRLGLSLLSSLYFQLSFGVVGHHDIGVVLAWGTD